MSDEKPVSREQALKWLEACPAWSMSEDGKSISRTLELESFTAAVKFMALIAAKADALNHHPDLHLTNYRRLKIVLTTFKTSSLSDKDFELASLIDLLPQPPQRS